MYPNIIFWGMGLYEICFSIGVVSALLIFRIVAEKKNASAKLQNFVLFDAFVSVVAGYCSAVLFQAVYNYFDSGIFEVKNNTGATFLGGLIGGVAVFLSVYFFIGYFLFKKYDGEHLKFFPVLLSLSGSAISCAHAFGRLGCFFAGCCHGVETDSILGMYMPAVGAKVVPVQLYECIFLFLLASVLLYLQLRKPSFLLGIPLYMVFYGIWRFIIEFFRGDDRGAFIIRALSPSQFISLLLVLCGIVLLVFFKWKYGKKKIN